MPGSLSWRLSHPLASRFGRDAGPAIHYGVTCSRADLGSPYDVRREIARDVGVHLNALAAKVLFLFAAVVLARPADAQTASLCARKR